MRSADGLETAREEGDSLLGARAAFVRVLKISAAVWVAVGAMSVLARAADLVTRLALGYSPGF